MNLSDVSGTIAFLQRKSLAALLAMSFYLFQQPSIIDSIDVGWLSACNVLRVSYLLHALNIERY